MIAYKSDKSKIIMKIHVIKLFVLAKIRRPSPLTRCHEPQVSRWLVEFVGHYPNSSTVEEAITSQFTFLITELLRGIGTASPSSTVGKY